MCIDVTLKKCKIQNKHVGNMEYQNGIIKVFENFS